MNTAKLREKIKEEGNLPEHIAIIMDGNGRWAKQRNKNTYQVTCADDLESQWFNDIKSVGISAGASTPDYLIEGVANRINKIDSSSDVGTLTNFKASTEPAGDNNACIYLTKEIRLKQEATAIKVMIDASVQDESELECYYKIKRSNQEVPFEDIEWTGFNTTGIPDKTVPVSVNAGDFREYEFTAGKNDDIATTTLPLAGFGSFAIKIVMKSLNTSKPPILRNFRTLALAE